MTKRIVVLILLTASILLAGDKKPKQSSPIMADVTARGRALYEYDQTAWHGTDAVLAMHPPNDWHPRYIARKSDNGWSLVFGVLNEQRDRFVIVYEATQGSTLQDFAAKKLDSPREDTGFYLAAAKAIDTALHDFKGERRPYNVAVLPATNDELYVYVYPAQTKNDIYPLGGDIRYLICRWGQRCREAATTQEHHRASTNVDSRRSHTRWRSPLSRFERCAGRHRCFSRPSTTTTATGVHRYDEQEDVRN